MLTFNELITLIVSFPTIYLTHRFPFCYVKYNIFFCIFVNLFLSLYIFYHLSAHSYLCMELSFKNFPLRPLPSVWVGPASRDPPSNPSLVWSMCSWPIPSTDSCLQHASPVADWDLHALHYCRSFLELILSLFCLFFFPQFWFLFAHGCIFSACLYLQTKLWTPNGKPHFLLY